MANASISQIKVGNITYDICDAVARDHTIIDDNYTIVDNELPLPNETKVYTSTRGFYIKDSEDDSRCGLKSVSYENGSQGVSVVTARKINNTPIYNEIVLGVDSNGSRTVHLSEAAPWRTALGLGTLGYAYPDGKSISNQTDTLLYTQNFSAGTFIVSVCFLFNANTNGRRAGYFTTEKSNPSASRFGYASGNAVLGTTTTLYFTHIIKNTAATDWYCHAWQNSGGGLYSSTALQWIKVA